MTNNRSRDILSFIRRFTRENGYPPTIREIGLAFKIKSTNGVRYHLSILERSGELKRTGRLSRGIGPAGMPLAVPSAAGYSIPILGRVAAGAPATAIESYEGSIEPLQMFGDPKGMFALRVRGDSMINAGIVEGDYVIVRQQESAEAGEIVVALIEDEATVKFYQPRRGSIDLVAANPKYSPIVVTDEMGFRILGVVRGVIRTLTR